MSDYDNTNTAVLFAPDESKTRLVGQGKWNDNSFDKKIVLIKETFPNGDEAREVYVKVGRLYENEQTTDKHPKYSGPISTDRGDMRMAAWQKETASGTSLLSLKMEEKRQPALPEENRSVDVDDDDVVPF